MVRSNRQQPPPASSGFHPSVEVEVKPQVTVDTAAFQRLDTAGAELVTTQTSCVRLDMEDLSCFEVLDHQYEQWGVTFNNAIAVQPSNPAYASRSGRMVVMGAPNSGWIEATFCRPVRSVSGFVTSSRRAILAAFDANNHPIARSEAPGSNLAGSGSPVPPNIQLSVDAANIHRITFSAFDGHLTLDELSFSF